jgi:hypothetical protein
MEKSHASCCRGSSITRYYLSLVTEAVSATLRRLTEHPTRPNTGIRYQAVRYLPAKTGTQDIQTRYTQSHTHWFRQVKISANTSGIQDWRVKKNKLATLAIFFFPRPDPFYIFGMLFSDLESENAELLARLASVLKNLFKPLKECYLSLNSLL